MSTFAKEMTAERRLRILRLLARADGYAANEYMLREALQVEGHQPSQDALRADFAWLTEQGLVGVKQIEDLEIVTLSMRGLDVAAGRAQVPGVKRPRPGE